jgi:hypothetical protein
MIVTRMMMMMKRQEIDDTNHETLFLSRQRDAMRVAAAALLGRSMIRNRTIGLETPTLTSDIPE